MLAVFLPVALIAIAIRIGENTKAISLIQLPLTFIHVARRVYQTTVTLAHATGPLALIDRPIFVLDCT